MNAETISPSSQQRVPADVARTVHDKAQTRLLSWALVAIAILFVVARALPILSCPIGRDQGTYLTVAQGLLEGKQLYRDVYDIKPPGIYIVYAGIAKLFGRVMWSVAVADVLLLLAISYLLFRFIEPYLGRAGAACAVMVHASMHGAMLYQWIAQAETFQLVCVLGSILVMRPSPRCWKAACFAAGLLFGYGCWLKYNALAFLPVLVLLPYLDRNALDRQSPHVSLTIPWRGWLVKIALLLTGIAAAIGIVLAWIVLNGGWPAMKEAQFDVLPRYAAMAVERNPHYLLSVFVRTNSYLGIRNLSAILAGLFVAWRRRDLGRFAPLFLATLSAYAATVMQVRFHHYYFQVCFPFLAAIWAYLVVSIYEGSRALVRNFRQRGWGLAAGLVWIVFAQAVFWPLPDEFNKLTMRYEELREWRADPETFYSHYQRQLPFEALAGQLAVIHHLEKNSGPSDPVYLWGAHCAIYFLSGHQPPTRFVSNEFIMSPWCPYSWRKELMRDLRNAQPRYIIVARHDAMPTITYVDLDSEDYIKTFPELRAFITSGYSPVADFDTFVVYRRN
ncbi:MAG: glycosyltransferase family 39 protein [Terriglobia bacterium]